MEPDSVYLTARADKALTAQPFEGTPGPWRIRETDAMFYIDGEPTEKPRRTYILQRKKRYQSKAYVTRTRADCHLIAAAPSLLDELKAVESHLQDYVTAMEGAGASVSKSAARLAAVRAAIAKALGSAA